jgi:hypothetical protein
MADLVFHIASLLGLFWSLLAGLSVLLVPLVPLAIVGASWSVWRAANRVSQAYRDTED